MATISRGAVCAPDIKSYIVDTNGGMALTCKPGQYVNLLLDGGKERYWTISGSPDLFSEDVIRRVEITVKLEPNGRGGSKQLWAIDSDQGLSAEVLGIDGEMTVDPLDPGEKRKLLFLSSGIGITPFLCIARCLAAAHAVGKAVCNCDVLMMHSTRGLDAVPYIEELRSIAKESPSWNTGTRFRILFFDTTKAADSQCDDVRLGRCGVEQMSTEISDIEERHAMICGGASFTTAMLKALAEGGVPENRIQTEAFDF